ncbi:MAG TPA: RNA 3'-terminal phosphate cyclase [Vicinamibacterales bacterium]|nr:RNA 3'-terminal phosphate cyclase [Vicinamibacterales bacterium]
MVIIDGSTGEGGGQVLRTSLALALATGTPFRIEKIRARRRKPGLMRQHLTAVQAAAAVGRALVHGAETGSQTLTFEPRALAPGDYTFSVGTAGSATLVLQTILPPLLRAAAPSTITLEGGTHNPWAPPFDFLERAFLPVVNRLGPRVTVALERAGFYPAGGGRFVAAIAPAPIAALTLCARGEIVTRRVRGVVSNLSRGIAEREVRTALELLNWSADAGQIATVDGPGPGNVVVIEIGCEHAVEVCTGFGEVGVTSEAVARRAVDDARRYLATDVPVGCHLADQLLPIMALGQGGVFRTMTLSQHARTNADVIRRFIDLDVDVVDESRDAVRVEMRVRG